MTPSGILDIVLIVVLIGYLVQGYRTGLIRSLGAIAGVVAGSIAAVFAFPFVSSWVPSIDYRVPAILLTAVVLIAAGLTIGSTVGRIIASPVRRSPLSIVDRLGGSAVNVVVAALVLSIVSSGIATLGVPIISQTIASSTVLPGIDRLTPSPVKSLLAQWRSLALEDGLPGIAEAFTGPAPTIPDVETTGSALAVAARSIVKITGNAYACGQNQSGSGIVIATDRILTNAHVVAGVGQPVVETLSDGSRVGKVVYFDPQGDLAVIAVSGLATPALKASAQLADGTAAVVDGYPLGGPFRSHPARVVSTSTIRVADIYGANPQPREVYTLASDVQEGESGGALLRSDGVVAGVIFAKSLSTPNVGYAITLTEVTPILTTAATLTSAVSSGTCVRK